jgi:hypothetical protein
MNKRPPRNGEKLEKKTNILLVDGNALFKRSSHKPLKNNCIYI